MLKKLLKKMGYVKESELFVDVTNDVKYQFANKKHYLLTCNGRKYLFTNHNLIIAQYRAEKIQRNL